MVAGVKAIKQVGIYGSEADLTELANRLCSLSGFLRDHYMAYIDKIKQFVIVRDIGIKIGKTIRPRSDTNSFDRCDRNFFNKNDHVMFIDIDDDGFPVPEKICCYRVWRTIAMAYVDVKKYMLNELIIKQSMGCYRDAIIQHIGTCEWIIATLAIRPSQYFCESIMTWNDSIPENGKPGYAPSISQFMDELEIMMTFFGYNNESIGSDYMDRIRNILQNMEIETKNRVIQDLRYTQQHNED